MIWRANSIRYSAKQIEPWPHTGQCLDAARAGTAPTGESFTAVKRITSHRRGCIAERPPGRESKLSILTSGLNPFRFTFGRQTLHDREVLFCADDHEMDALA